MKKKLVLLDAYALIYRSHFAFIRRPLLNSKGFNVSALTGFASTLQDLLNKEKPTHFAIAFDPSGPTVRNHEYDFYKANREEMPEDIRLSLPYIRRLADAYNIPILEVDGYEADDIIGTIAKKAAADGFKVYMVTPDKDYEQLVEENIFMYKPARSGKPSEIYDVQKVLDKWGIEKTTQVIDILGLMGDAVDNIPGIKGVGEKTAAKLIRQFGSVENMLENTHEIKGKLREKVENDKENAIISKYLATIILDVPIAYEPEEYTIQEINKEKLTELFHELEFRTLGKRVLGDDYELVGKTTKKTQKTGQLGLFDTVVNEDGLPEVPEGKNIHNTPHDYKIADTAEKRASLIQLLNTQSAVSFDTETTSVDANNAELVGLSFSFETGTGWYVPIPKEQTEARAIVQEFKDFFANEKIDKIAQNIKYDMLVLKWYDVEVKGTLQDTMLAHYLLEPDMRHNLTILSETYLNYKPIDIVSLIGKKGKKQKSMRQVAVETVAEYAVEDADLTWQLHQHFTQKITQKKLQKLYADVEVKLVPVLAEIEYNGVALDTDFLKNYSKELVEELKALQTSIFQQAGTEFNLDSPKQLGNVLFGTMGIPYKGAKTKTGQYSTNEATLTKLASEHAIVNDILSYRELNKLRNTYVDALPTLLNPKTKRIHSSFNQAVAATGRLSSANPNLQNIPIRTDRGRKVRQAFIPRGEGYVLFAADYSQIELRLMAAMSGDKAMKEAFINGTDIHTATAARVYGVSLDKVDGDMRRKAKMVNFGIIYGISAFGLSQRLSIPRSEAKEIIDEYFNQYAGIQEYMDRVVEEAKENGYVETILGRRRYLKDINSRNRTTRQFAERNAINTPIQGSAADMIKVAMINIHQAMQERQMQSKMILQVHDELVFDALESELDELKTLVEDKMKHAITLSVPLEVGMGIGQNWLEAH